MNAPVSPIPKLPQDVKSLSELRDQLGNYLSAVERNTDAVNGWLAENKIKIILSHQRLDRAINKKDEKEAVSLIAGMGDIAGFVLSMQDFTAKAEDAFGKNSAFQKSIANITGMLPASLQEPLPHLSSVPDGTMLPEIALEGMPAKPKQNDKWWAPVSDFFNKEEKQREEQEFLLRSQLRAVKVEILGLQSDRHYYVDSFMDWVADTMAPEAAEDDGKTADIGAKMLQYQNPSYIINLAHADYQDAVETRAKAVRESALVYAGFAKAIDSQDVPDFAARIQDIYNSGAEQEVLRKIMLEDYQSESLAEVIMKNIESRDNQAELLRSSLFVIVNEPLLFTDAKTPQEIFDKFFSLALDENDPLAPTALFQIIATLKLVNKIDAASLVFSTSPEYGGRNIFQRAAERFADDLSAQESLLTALLVGMDSNHHSPAAHNCVHLSDSLKQKNAAAVSAVLEKIRDDNSVAETAAIWQLCNPGQSLLDNLRGISPDPAVKAAILEQGLQAGLMGEIRIGGNEKQPFGTGSPLQKFENLMQKDVLPDADKFPVHTARHIIAHSFNSNGLDDLRRRLTQADDGWLEKIVSGTVDDGKKAEWVAALLEPFKSDIVKANILHEAARNSASEDAAQALSLLEKNMVGENIRLSDNEILCNLPRIANIWYSSDSKMLRYTVQGQSHTILDDVAPPMAAEILSLIQRRGGFMPEYDGLFKPENIDAIHHTHQGTSISWYRTTGFLNADEETLTKLESRGDFMHVEDPATGYVSSYNIAGICLLQKLEDGSSLMIDKYGTGHILEGGITIAGSPALLDIGSTVKFNPDNAAIIRLDHDRNSFEFRVEGSDFEKLLDRNAGQFFYNVEMQDPASFRQLKGEIEKRADIHAIGSGELSGLYFNIKTLGYLAYDEKLSGFYCKRHSPLHKPGFIQVDEDMAEEIISTIGAKAGVTKTGDLLIHEGSIDHIKYISAKEALQFVAGGEVQEIGSSYAEASAIFKELTKNRQLTTISGAAREAVNSAHATLVLYKPAQDKTQVITNTMPFPVNIAGNSAPAFIGDLEKQGLVSARKESSSRAWTQDISKILAASPKISVRISPSIGNETPQILLQQVLAGGTKAAIATNQSDAADKPASAQKKPKPSKMSKIPRY